MSQKIIATTEAFVRDKLEGEGSGHDWWHIHRVRRDALNIAKKEDNCNLFVVEMAALLHDVADPKLHGGDNTKAREHLHQFLDTLDLEERDKQEIINIVENSSFSRSLDGKDSDKSKEFMAVQDADRLDAIGAIGIARCFMYSGHKNRLMYDPNIKYKENLTKEEYRSNEGSAINHFYEKLLFLKDMMNTESAKRIAEDRHNFMQQYLEQFYKEWGE